MTSEIRDALTEAIDDYDTALSSLSDALSNAAEGAGSTGEAEAIQALEPDLGVPEKLRAWLEDA